MSPIRMSRNASTTGVGTSNLSARECIDSMYGCRYVNDASACVCHRSVEGLEDEGTKVDLQSSIHEAVCTRYVDYTGVEGVLVIIVTFICPKKVNTSRRRNMTRTLVRRPHIRPPHHHPSRPRFIRRLLQLWLFLRILYPAPCKSQP